MFGHVLLCREICNTFSTFCRMRPNKRALAADKAKGRPTKRSRKVIQDEPAQLHTEAQSVQQCSSNMPTLSPPVVHDQSLHPSLMERVETLQQQVQQLTELMDRPSYAERRAAASSQAPAPQIPSFTGAINDMIQTSVHNADAAVEDSFRTLGRSLDVKIISKIIAGNYIDLTTLQSQDDKLSFTFERDGSGLVLGPTNKRQIGSVFEWLRLFSTYAAVLTSARPALAPSLFTYQSRILDLHKRHQDSTYLIYDEKFRRLKAVSDMEFSWDSFEMTLLYESIQAQASTPQ